MSAKPTSAAVLPQRQYLTINRATELYGISRSRLYNAMADGLVEYVTGADGRRRVPAEAMEHFVRSGGQRDAS